jgi:hypothetical protein
MRYRNLCWLAGVGVLLSNAFSAYAQQDKPELWKITVVATGPRGSNSQAYVQCLPSKSGIDNLIFGFDHLFGCAGSEEKSPDVAIINNNCSIDGQEIETRSTIIRERDNFLLKIEKKYYKSSLVRKNSMTWRGKLMGPCKLK